MKKIGSIVGGILVFIGLALVLYFMEDEETAPSKEGTPTGDVLDVHFIDVGQGDAIALRSPSGKTMLIDGGKKSRGEDVVRFLREHGIETLDYVVATHPDADHIGGLISVLEQMDVKTFIDSGKVHTTQTYARLLELIDANDIEFVVPNNGDPIDFDPNVTMQVVNAVKEASNNNEASIVLYATYGDVSFLLTGDADVSIERDMLTRYELPTTVLKAGHHGSDTSSDPQFVKQIAPEVVILSYGEGNSYGHPHSRVLQTIEEVGATAYSTATEGDITVRTDGQSYEVAAQPFDLEESDERLNINEATQEQLQELPGIGPATAQKIIDYRSVQPFETVEQLMEVDGIGPKTFDALQSSIRVK